MVRKRESAKMEYERNLIICRCEEITFGEICDAIEDGARDLNGVKRRTRATMGLCQGKTCAPLIERILCDRLGLSPAELPPISIRPPVRPLTLEEMARGLEGI